MTAEVDARSEVSQVREKRGLDFEDLAKGGAHVDVGISLPKGKEIDSDGACGSYVMISGSGSEEVADPSREVELECFGNGTIEIDAEPKIENLNDPKVCVSQEIGGVGHVVGKNLGESASNRLKNDIEARKNVSDGDEKQGEDTETESSEKVEEIPKSEGSVCEAADGNCNRPQSNCREDKHDVKITSDSEGIVGESEELKSSTTQTDALVTEQNGDAVSGIVSGETCATTIDRATRMDIVGDRTLDDHALILEKSSQDSEKDKFLVGDKDAQTEGNRQLKNTVMASSIIMVGSVEINCENAFPPLPISNGAIKSFQFFPAVENLRLDVKVKSSPETIDNPDSCSLQETKIEAKSENGTVDEDTQSSCLSNDQGNLNHEADVSEVESNGSTCEEVKVVDEINSSSSSGTLECSSRDTAEPLNVVFEVGSEPDYFVGSSSSEEDTRSSCLSIDQGSINHASEVNEVESTGSTCQEVEVIDEINWDLSLETQSSNLDTAEPLNVVTEVGSGPFYFVRIPRYEDEFIREKIKHAQSLVDERTQIRDSFRDQIQTTKAACKELGSNLSAAKSEARAARESLKLKRKEIEIAQSMIYKAKDAISMDDIGIRMNKMEHKIAHETIPLKEDKKLVRDIKQLTQLRDQLSLDAGKQGELQLALDQKGEFEERLTLLRKEMDLIIANVLKADELTTSMLKNYDGEREKFNGLQAQFEEANKIRQEAYVQLHCLKKPFDEKHKYFRKYRHDMQVADNLALRKDGEKLQAHAINQVETFMERWNNDDEFRKDYIRCNTRSTLRRLGGLDGRSLAPDEEQPVLDNVMKERAATDNLVSPGLAVEQNKPAGPVETLEDNHKPAKWVTKKKKKTKTKNPVAAGTALPDDQASVSSGVELVDTKDCNGLDFADTREEEKRSKEEEELEKRAEELRKEEEEIRLNEELKLKEKAKAEIALERKRRKAERAQARAAIRAQKEAEEIAKEKEKKAARRRKKRKCAGGADKNKAGIEEEPAVSMETETPTATPVTAENSNTTSANPQKRPHKSKQNKSKAIIPPPLRKRSKRKMETWVWLLLTVMIVVLALFFLGNGSYLEKLGMGNLS